MLDIESRALFSTAELERKTQLALERRREAGISDDIPTIWRTSSSCGRPPLTPSSSANGSNVLWKYFDKSKGNKPTLIWASGRVVRVADGLTNKRTKAAKTVLPAGALLWAWDADPEFDEKAGEQWLILLPKKWNKHVHYGWRFDPREFGGEREREAPPGAKRMRRAAE